MTALRGLVSTSKLALINDNRVGATTPKAQSTLHQHPPVLAARKTHHGTNYFFMDLHAEIE